MKRLASLCLSFCLAAVTSGALPETAASNSGTGRFVETSQPWTSGEDALTARPPESSTSDLPPSTNAAAQQCSIVAIPEYMTTNNSVTARRSMTDALLAAGVVPVVLPEMDDDAADQFLAHCDAVMIGGGDKDQDYDRRCAFEDRVLSLAARRGLAIVGICHGCQVINRHFGGTIGPVPEERKLVHRDVARLNRTGRLAEHFVTVRPGNSLMSRTFGEGRIKVNSSHKLRCEEIAPGFRVTAVSEEDNVIEAIEHETLSIYGFQFHPESYRRINPRCLDLLRCAFEKTNGRFVGTSLPGISGSGAPAVRPPESSASGLQPSTNAAARPRRIVAIPDYIMTNRVVLARRAISEMLLDAGFVPVVLPEMDDAPADQVLALCDAVLLGGAVSGQNGVRRRLFEERILALAEKRGLTVVGICNGCQIINRHFGGTFGPVPKKRQLVHKNVAHLNQTGMLVEHGVTVLPGNSLMSRTLGEGRVMVNSSHTYRCEKIAPGFRVTAVSEEDGIAEAIEHETKPIYGFQFHPEYYRRKDPRFLDLVRRAFETRP